MSDFRAKFELLGYDVGAVERAAVTKASEFSIHSPESIRFMKQVVGASSNVLRLLENGLTPAVNVPNPPYKEENNLSACQDMDFVQEKVGEWLKDGFVSKLSEPAVCNNPLSLILKYDAFTDKVKKRLCLDLSRFVNKCVPDEPVKLDDLSVSEKIVEPGDFMTAFDLKNQFFHVRLHPAARQFFGFKITGKDGKPEFYHFNVLPYGFKPAVSIVTKLLLPIKAFLHRFGVRLTLYVDDGRILGQDFSETRAKTDLTLLVLQLAGWNIQWSKTCNIPMQSLYHLGFITDTVAMRYSTPVEKIKVLKELLGALVLQGLQGQLVKAKVMAQALGKIISLIRSHGNIMQIMSRSAQHALSKQVFRHGWFSFMLLDTAVVREFQFVITILDVYNGQYIYSAITATHVFELADVQNRIDIVKNSEQSLPLLYVALTDEAHSFVYLADGTFSFVQEHTFEDQQSMGSGHREIRTVIQTLNTEKLFLSQLAPAKIFWQTDSRNCYLFLSKGSRNPAIQSDIVMIKSIERDMCLKIVPVWTPKEQGRLVLADMGLRFSTSTDEWSISRPLLWDIFQKIDFSPTVDCCASKHNAICAVYFSGLPQSTTSGINFLAQTLVAGQSYFCCPPVSIIVQCFKKLTTTPDIVALLLIPEWTGAVFWPYIFNGKKYSEKVKTIIPFKPNFFFSNQAVSKVFSHKPNFRMLALKIVT